ncbi:MAG: hypothetical protein ACLGQH_06935 [Acidobacteriota bacterium]
MSSNALGLALADKIGNIFPPNRCQRPCRKGSGRYRFGSFLNFIGRRQFGYPLLDVSGDGFGQGYFFSFSGNRQVSS